MEIPNLGFTSNPSHREACDKIFLAAPGKERIVAILKKRRGQALSDENSNLLPVCPRIL